ncbi:hypothetical protein [Vibrio barjaei]|nr:hypothetical protein [Vibrio barjaei]MCY9870494.1 hypothetical protein [Vibrio barjaei]
MSAAPKMLAKVVSFDGCAYQIVVGVDGLHGIISGGFVENVHFSAHYN